MQKDVHQVEKVFTPTTPARATFVEREAINDKLVNALRTPGKQIVVYGHSGSGKSTLLENKLHQIYEHHISSRCVEGMTFDQLILNAFDQLNAYYDAERVQTKRRSLAPGLEFEYLAIKAKIDADIVREYQTKKQRILPPQLTPQTLATFMGQVNCCWVLEDFHKIEEREKKRLAQVMKLFMDMSDEFSSLKIIAIGAVDTARQVIEYDQEMRNRVSEIYVPLMTDIELDEIITRGEQLLNFSIPSSLKKGIVEYSNGLASVCHQLCLNICFAAGIDITLPQHIVINNEELEKALQMYLDNASDTLKAAFDKAFSQIRKSKYDNGKLILKAMAQSDQDGVTRSEILDQIRKEVSDYPAGNLTLHLKQLQTRDKGALIRYDSYSRRYSFSDPIFRAFAMALFIKKKSPFGIAFGDIAISIVMDMIGDKLVERLKSFDTTTSWITVAQPLKITHE
jgi:energy-coupling factor transporter ATP-binding protein EcfA2